MMIFKDSVIGMKNEDEGLPLTCIAQSRIIENKYTILALTEYTNPFYENKNDIPKKLVDCFLDIAIKDLLDQIYKTDFCMGEQLFEPVFEKCYALAILGTSDNLSACFVTINNNTLDTKIAIKGNITAVITDKMTKDTDILSPKGEIEIYGFCLDKNSNLLICNNAFFKHIFNKELNEFAFPYNEQLYLSLNRDYFIFDSLHDISYVAVDYADN